MNHSPDEVSDGFRMDRSLFAGRVTLIELTDRVDGRGGLLPFDFRDLPFQPRRAFITHDVPAGTTRGGHAHKQGMQLLIRVSGRVLVALRDARKQETCVLQRSDIGLLIGPGIWSQQTYLEPGTSLLVFASTSYDSASYLTDPQ